MDAIEAKIENARKRLEEKKKIKSNNAKNVVKTQKRTTNQQLESEEEYEEMPKRVQGNRFKGS